MAWRDDRHASRGAIECGFRAIEGDLPGLTARWRHGVGQLEPGRIVFTGTVGGVRFLKRRPVVIDLVEVDQTNVRRPGWAQAMSVNPGARVLPVGTPNALLEWAVNPPSRVAWAIERLSAPDA